MSDLADVLVACEGKLLLLDEADALGVLGLLVQRAINRQPPEQRAATVTAFVVTLERGVTQ